MWITWFLATRSGERRRSDRVDKDHNKRVQEAIMLVLDRFRATGTVRKTFKWFHEEKVELPVPGRS
jgi:hypothetical protein